MEKEDREAGWTPARKALLKKYWQEGLTGSQIAKTKFDGRFSRGAIVSAVTRFKLVRAKPAEPKVDKRTKPVSSFGFLEMRPKKKADPDRPPLPRSKELPVPDLPGTVAPENIKPGMCKWPIGDPSTLEFLFCGRKTENPRDPYCLAHKRPAMKPPSTSVRALERSLRRFI